MLDEYIPRGIFKAIIDSTNNAIIIIDSRGVITAFNKAAAEIVGVKEEEALCRHIKEIIPHTGLINVLETGEAQISQKIILNGYVCLSHRTPIFYDSKVWGAIVVFDDISGLEKITEELKSYTNLIDELEAIIESSSDGIYVTNGSGYTVRVNSAYEEITGIKREEVLGKHMKELVEEGFYSQSVTLLVLQRKEPVSIIQKIKNNKDVIVTGNPVKDETGDIKFVVTSVRDVSSLTKLQQELQNARALSDKYQEELKKLKPSNIAVKSSEMLEILSYAKRVAPFPTTVFLYGESGVGKEIVAEFIHQNSDRANNNFIKVNCGAIPENLLESELFGYESGAFTGAHKKGKPGMFELADNGTLLLDEVSELPLNLQVKLLRVLQENNVKRLGGIESKKVNVRLISASNKNIEEMVSRGMFREDLYYRLNVINITVPPLKERSEDVMYLAEYFLETFNKEYNMIKKFDPGIKKYFENYSWPGNVRELKNLIENLVVSTTGEIITELDLPNRMTDKNCIEQEYNIEKEELIPLEEAVKKAEIDAIKKALLHNSSLRQASKLLKINHSTLSRKINKYGLNDLLQ